MILRSCCAAAVLVSLAIGSAVAAPWQLDSGVTGFTLIGPTCPVQRIGESCERPYRATIAIRQEPSDRLVARVRSGADGHFKVRLPAGQYLLQPRGGTPFPRVAALRIKVRLRRFTSVTIRFDTGIR